MAVNKFSVLLDKAWELLGENGEDHLIDLFEMKIPEEERIHLAKSYLEGAMQGIAVREEERKRKHEKEKVLTHRMTDPRLR